jgi:hypothetical protein
MTEKQQSHYKKEMELYRFFCCKVTKIGGNIQTFL